LSAILSSENSFSSSIINAVLSRIDLKNSRRAAAAKHHYCPFLRLPVTKLPGMVAFPGFKERIGATVKAGWIMT
jgi:hypothetical protein